MTPDELKKLQIGDKVMCNEDGVVGEISAIDPVTIEWPDDIEPKTVSNKQDSGFFTLIPHNSSTPN